MELADQLVDTWQIHNRINLYMLDAISAEGLASPLLKGKSVGSQFAHIHNVRLMWLKASAPELLEGLEKLEQNAASELIHSSLCASSEAIAVLLKQTLASGGRIKNFRPHVSGFLAYLVAHESHHRGQIEIALRQAGIPLSDKTSFGLWEWGTR